MKRCVIVGNAEIANYAFVKKFVKDDDYFIVCDGGLKHVESLSISPDLIVGDFDSYEKPDTDVELIELPREKDDTDSVFAAKEAVKRDFKEVLLIGVTGGRIDHTIANISILLMLKRDGISACIVDDYSVIQLIDDKTFKIDDSCRYFSILNINGSVRGVNIKNAKYPLMDAEISSDYQYGVSNEVLPGKIAEVYVNVGEALLIRVYNEICHNK